MDTEPPPPSAVTVAVTFDDIFKRIKSYGVYQIFFLLTVQYACLPQASNAAGGFFSLGGLIPNYTCHDVDNQFVLDKTSISANSSAACIAIRSCHNLTTENAWYSMYEEFEWMCVPPYLMSTIASFMPAVSIVGFLVAGHLADHFGRKWLAFAGLCITLFGGIACALTPNWEIYLLITIIKQFTQPVYYGAAFALCMESVSSNYRLVQSFSFQWSLGYIFAGLMAYLTAHWRVYYALVNAIGLPSLIMLLFVEESPRFLVQKKRYTSAANAVNKIARWNRRQVRYTAADMKAVEIGSQAKKHVYNIFHLFSQRKLALYSLAQIITGISINIVSSVLIFNIQDLAGSPFLNIACMGLLRIWTPFAAIALERYSSRFGRKMLLVGSQVIVCLCYSAMLLIDMIGYWEKLHVVVTILALFGYAIEIGLVWIGYKLYTTELFPTVVRTIALNTFSLTSLIGSAIGPQLIFVGRVWWHPTPYAGSALITLCSIAVSLLVLPETRGRAMPDSLEEIKSGRLHKIDTATAKELDALVSKTTD